jgi:hypothetical protein
MRSVFELVTSGMKVGIIRASGHCWLQKCIVRNVYVRRICRMYICICMCMYVYICMFVCMYVCVYVCMYVYMYVYVCMCVCM